MTKRMRRTFTPEQKAQICAEYLQAKKRTEPGTRPGIIAACLRRHDVREATVKAWIAAREAMPAHEETPSTSEPLLDLMIAATDAGVIEEDQADRILGIAVRRGWR